jgi:hypothetical protein
MPNRPQTIRAADPGAMLVEPDAARQGTPRAARSHTAPMMFCLTIGRSHDETWMPIAPIVEPILAALRLYLTSKYEYSASVAASDKKV